MVSLRYFLAIIIDEKVRKSKEKMVARGERARERDEGGHPFDYIMILRLDWRLGYFGRSALAPFGRSDVRVPDGERGPFRRPGISD